jgi:hypothetical protein
MPSSSAHMDRLLITSVMLFSPQELYGTSLSLTSSSSSELFGKERRRSFF